MVTRRNILVTGAAGQLGSELRELASGFPFLNFMFTTREDLDITNVSAVSSWFNQFQPAWVINCAAYTAVDKAEQEQDEAFRINALAPGILAKACEECQGRMIHISTDYVFDGNAGAPYAVTAHPNPKTVYGASKLAGEQAVLKASPSAIIIRTSWVYSRFGHNFVKTMIRLMAERTELRVVDDQVGSPTWAADLAAAILQIIEHCNSVDSSAAGIYHYSNTGAISWYRFALAIREHSGSKCIVMPVTTAEYPTPARRPAWSVLDTSGIVTQFGISLHPWEESLARCIALLKK